MSAVPPNFPDRSVCILGLGYVGLTLATVMADVGFEVLGIEVRNDALEKLAKGEPHFFEPGLADQLRRLVQEKKLRVAKQIPPDCRASVYIITVGTPLDAKGKSRLDMVMNVAREVADRMKAGDLVVMRSTVKPGTTRKTVLPLLEKAGKNFDLAFCPERTLEGQALVELRQLPQIIGGATSHAADRAAQIFQFVTPTVIRVSSLETAEMIKLIDNAQRDVLFAYANEVARICDAVGISAEEVIRVGKQGYSRTHVPMPGPVGGPCLTKDSYILAEGLGELGIEPEITLAARRINERQPSEVIASVARMAQSWNGFPAQPVISLLGIAFKGRPATDDLRGTTARPILDALKIHFPSSRFRGYDPVVPAGEIEKFGLSPSPTLDHAFKGAHLVFILNNHLQMASMPVADLAQSMARPGLIYDFWNNFTSAKLSLPAGTGYMALGSHGQARIPERTT